ncbi:A24 family peptidase [Leucobacter sp. NPDC077196]|uniref:A24 family peptidase n=1 Tax=Leucobacter sp. NPDC077196 TaxID=3154959 RepID=UPI0034469187
MPMGEAAAVETLAVSALAVFAWWSVVLSISDLRTRRLPNGLLLLATLTTVPLLLATAGAHALTGEPPAALVEDRSAQRTVVDTLGVALAYGGAFVALWRCSPAGIGGGDVKLAPLVGAVLGATGGWASAVSAAALAFGFAAIWGTVSRCRLEHREPLQAVPFAPCLFAGAWAAITCV